jgi:hypothetical protein
MSLFMCAEQLLFYGLSKILILNHSRLKDAALYALCVQYSVKKPYNNAI